jgi:hypothetical protein
MTLIGGYQAIPGYPDVVPPKFATLRDPDAPTLGTRQALFADVWLRRPLLPHQRYIVDTAGELTEAGKLRRSLVIVTFQRQGGKSHLCMTKNGERCLSCSQYRAFYTAQTGGDAQDQFLKFNDEIVVGTPLDRIVNTRRGNGKADMTFGPTGSTLTPRPPTAGAGHGKQSDSYDVDEAWAFSTDEGKAIMQAIAPTQLTRAKLRPDLPGSQVWIWSAGGTAESTWLAALLARARDGDDAIALFEWGIPDDLDVDDLAAVLDYHPAKDTLIDLDSLRDMRDKLDDPSEFARAGGNRWTEAIAGAIPWSLWEQRRYEADIPDDAPIGWGAARATDGQHVVLAAAAAVHDPDLGPIVVAEVVEVVPVHEAGGVIKHYAGRDAVAVNPTGASAALYDELNGLKVRQTFKLGPKGELRGFTDRDAGVACTNTLDAIKGGRLRFKPHDALDGAVRVAGTRTVGDGGKAWARTAAGAPVAAIEACSNAAWALAHKPPTAGKPVIYFGPDAA